MDFSKTESRLQKDVEKVVEENRKLDQNKHLIEKEKKDREAESSIAIEEEFDEKSDDEKPEGIIQPKFKLVHSYPVDIADSWEGHKDASEGQSLKQMHKLPAELTVTIYVKYIESLKAATLDINDTTLMFKYPDVYYLDINLMYKVDKLNGTAKFDKTKKTLTVRVPVIGSTDESQKVLDQHYRAYKETHENSQKGLKNLQKSKIDDEMELRRLKKKGVSAASTNAEDDEDEQQQNQENTADNKVPDFMSQFEEAAQGVSKPRVLMNESTTDTINDKYE
jgi:hypothetical protein